MQAYDLPPDLALAFKLGAIAGLIILGLSVLMAIHPRKSFGATPLRLGAWGGVVIIISTAPWLSVRSDVALGLAIAFLGALVIGVVTFTRSWDRSTMIR